MKKRVTIKDVAKASQVSISTVSRYLASPASINPISAVSISKAIKALNYMPNPFAQKLKREHADAIAVIMPDVANRYMSEACKAMCSLFSRDNYLVMICDCDYDLINERHYIEEMIKNRVAGLMICSCGGNTDFLKKIVASEQRIVLYDQMELDVGADLVYEDNFMGSCSITRAMLKQGHRRFVVLNGSEHAFNMQIRLMGVKKALEEEGLSLEEEYVIKNLLNASDITKTVERLMEDKKCPRCFLANNPVLLHNLVYTINRLGISVPNEVSIAGFAIDDLRYVYPFSIPIALQNPVDVGMQAAELMLKRLRNKNKMYTPKHIMLPMRVIIE